MTNLSPAAQAVMIAAFGKWMEIDDIDDDIPGKIAVAALRAAADHLPSSAMYPSCDWGYGWRTGISDAKQKLLSIAAELEITND